jgi:hypothetical protein
MLKKSDLSQPVVTKTWRNLPSLVNWANLRTFLVRVENILHGLENNGLGMTQPLGDFCQRTFVVVFGHMGGIEQKHA